MITEEKWMANDMKFEFVRMNARRFREEYKKKFPDSSVGQQNRYVNKKIKNAADFVFNESLEIMGLFR